MGEAVAVCYSLGVITGTDGAGSFSPQGRMTRVQTAVIYTRLKKLMKTETGLAFQPGISIETSTGTSIETSGGTLTSGQPVAVENVLALMEEYKNGKKPGTKAKETGFTSYRHLATYPANNGYYLSSLGRNGIECAIFAYAFKPNATPSRAESNASQSQSSAQEQETQTQQAVTEQAAAQNSKERNTTQYKRAFRAV